MMQPATSRRPDNQRAQPPPDPVIAVWHCRSKQLSAPDKRAFEFLWRATGGGAATILVTPTDVANDQGTSSDAGKDRLDNLTALGFIARQPWGKKGNYRVACLDPWQALDGLRPVGQKDPQTVLGFATENISQPASEDRPFGVVSGAEPKANLRFDGCGLSPGGEASAEVLPDDPEEAPEDPRRPFLSSERGVTQSPSSIFGTCSGPSVDSTSPKVSEHGRRGSSGSSSAAAGQPEDPREAELLRQWRLKLGVRDQRLPATPLASAVGARLSSLPSPQEQQAAVEARAQHIFDRVNCPNMRMSPCLRMAWAIVEGRIDPGEVDELIRNLNKAQGDGLLVVPRSVYANRGFDRLCVRHGVPLPTRKPKPK